MTEPLYRLIASRITARMNCLAPGANAAYSGWAFKHSEALRQIERELLPSGSGIDNGTTIDLDRSNGDRIVLVTSFHHMDEGGGYAGWTEHTVTIRPSFSGIDVSIGGRNRNDIKDYLADVFRNALSAKILSSYDRETETLSFRIVD